ncbi:MAG TPA: TIM barrel protein [Chloroflexota bacterium]|nr:TIM barrel protein [Chloroflexota bacterium]
MMDGDPIAAFDVHAGLMAHIQIADAPGRHQPGTGQAPVMQFLQHLDERGYSGYVGLEYYPQGTTEEALAWLPREARGPR